MFTPLVHLFKDYVVKHTIQIKVHLRGGAKSLCDADAAAPAQGGHTVAAIRIHTILCFFGKTKEFRHFLIFELRMKSLEKKTCKSFTNIH